VVGVGWGVFLGLVVVVLVLGLWMLLRGG
jgi:hypothetical protein